MRRKQPGEGKESRREAAERPSFTDQPRKRKIYFSLSLSFRHFEVVRSDA